MAFPSSPTNGQVYTQSGTSYIYDSTYGVWNINTTAINADTLDSIDSSSFLRSDQRATTAYDIQFTGTGIGSGIIFNSTVVTNDAFGIRVNGTSNAGELEFFSTDDDTEPFVFRHYTTGQDGSGSSVEWARINNDYLSHTSDIRAPLFYDSDNTAFYVDPASISLLNTLVVRPSSASGVGTAPAGVSAYIDSSTNNYLLFRNSADNGTYSGLVMQDNNIGGYVIFGNAGGAGDKMYVAGYGGVDIQYGTSDSVNPSARTTVASFTSSGMSVTSITETSSIRFKENVTPIDNALESVLQLSGVTYDRKDTGAKHEPGLIAEDVLNILPEIVEINDEGLPSGVKYTRLIAYLVESIKDLQGQINDLKSK